MPDYLQLAWEVWKWFARNPKAVQSVYLVHKAAVRTYRDLSPEKKAVVDRWIRWGVEELLKRALPVAAGDVFSEVFSKVLSEVGSVQIAELAKKAVERGVKVGVERALEEVHKA